MLDSVSTKLPAVMEAFQMTTKVSRVDFDWPDVPSVLEKLDEEVDELKQAIGGETPPTGRSPRRSAICCSLRLMSQGCWESIPRARSSFK
jgi:hypothetical protein